MKRVAGATARVARGISGHPGSVHGDLRRAGVEGEREANLVNDAGMFARLRAFPTFDGRRRGEWALTAITEDKIEAFYVSLAGFAASTRNQYVQLLKASFS